MGSEGQGDNLVPLHLLPNYLEFSLVTVWTRISLLRRFLTCQGVPQADAPRAIDCSIRYLDHVEDGKAHADQSEGQGQEEEQQNCHMKAGVELLHQVWEDWREKTWPIVQCQSSSHFHRKPKLASQEGFGRGG